MKTTLGELAKSIDALRRVASHPFPSKTRFDLIKVLGKAERELKRYREVLTGIFKKHGTEVEPEQFKIKKENLEDCRADIKELEAIEVTFKGERFALDKIEAVEAVTAADVVALPWLIELPIDEDEETIEPAAAAVASGD